MPKVRKAELSFLYATGRLDLFYISTKYHQNIPKSIIRVKKLSFLYVTHLILFYISTKYHPNIPKGIPVTKQSRSFIPMLMLKFYAGANLSQNQYVPQPFGRGDNIQSWEKIDQIIHREHKNLTYYNPNSRPPPSPNIIIHSNMSPYLLPWFIKMLFPIIFPMNWVE